MAAGAKQEAEAQYATLLANAKKLGNSEVDKVLGEKRDQATALLAQLISNALAGKGGGDAGSLAQVPEYKVLIDVATVKCTQSALPQSVIPFVALVRL